MTNSAASPSPDRVRINEMLGDEITLLAGQLDVGSYRMIKLIAECDERKAWGDGGGRERCRLLYGEHWMFGIKPAVFRVAVNPEPWNPIT